MTENVESIKLALLRMKAMQSLHKKIKSLRDKELNELLAEYLVRDGEYVTLMVALNLAED